VDLEKLFIVDAVTSSFTREKAPERVTFVPSPDALTDLNIAIIEIIKNEKCDYLVFDSISTLLTYRNDTLVARFTDFVVGKVKELKSKAIFTCLNGDSKTQAIQEISLHVNKVINFSENGKEEKKK
jgi:KaiC/GvpD/RAD55 family RecA-like ATPase